MGLYCALAGICVFIKIRSLVQARDDAVGGTVLFCGWMFLRQKNIRTKDPIECSNVCSSELDVHLFIQ